jgi:alkylation response protein AidB-like acyl-CoA dehydrogenase
MTPLTVARDMPLDDLVVRVYHLELLECQDFDEFKDAIRLMRRNLDEVIDALACDLSRDRRVQRSIDRVKLKAARMKELCAAIPKSLDDPQGWRPIAEQIMVNYELFRIEAGLLYRLAVPGSSFGVLRAAL